MMTTEPCSQPHSLKPNSEAKKKPNKQPTVGALRTPLTGSPAFVSTFDFVFDEPDRPEHHAGLLHDAPGNHAHPA